MGIRSTYLPTYVVKIVDSINLVSNLPAWKLNPVWNLENHARVAQSQNNQNLRLQKCKNNLELFVHR